MQNKSDLAAGSHCSHQRIYALRDDASLGADCLRFPKVVWIVSSGFCDMRGNVQHIGPGNMVYLFAYAMLANCSRAAVAWQQVSQVVFRCVCLSTCMLQFLAIFTFTSLPSPRFLPRLRFLTSPSFSPSCRTFPLLSFSITIPQQPRIDQTHHSHHERPIPLLHRRRPLLHAAHPSHLPRQRISLAPHDPQLPKHSFNIHRQLHRRRPRPPANQCP